MLPRMYAAMVHRIDNRHFHIVGLPVGLDAPDFGSRIEGERWLAANLPKLKALQKRRRRPCLRCGEDFDSEGIHNRLCTTCRKLPADALGDPQRPYLSRSA